MCPCHRFEAGGRRRTGQARTYFILMFEARRICFRASESPGPGRPHLLLPACSSGCVSMLRPQRTPGGAAWWVETGQISSFFPLAGGLDPISNRCHPPWLRDVRPRPPSAAQDDDGTWDEGRGCGAEPVEWVRDANWGRPPASPRMSTARRTHTEASRWVPAGAVAIFPRMCGARGFRLFYNKFGCPS